MNKKLAEELRRRAASKEQFDIEKYCFDKQLKFIKDPSRFKTAVCSRRGGKTIACAADLMHTAISVPGDVAYITLNRITAKRIIWRELLKINKQFNLNCKVDNNELTLTLPNGNIIYVSGAKDASEIEKFRGLALRKVYIDEAQSFRAYIKDLVEDVIEPALTDYNGSLCLIGTPGPVPAGFFYDMSTRGQYSAHHWTMQDNPYIKIKSGREPLDVIKEIAKRRGLTLDDDSIQREYFGKWVKDEKALVFKYNADRNHYFSLPEEELEFIFGIDIGWKDSDAIAVLGYSYTSKHVYLVEEAVTSKQDITALVTQIKELQKKYKPVSMVMDAGALGKKIQEEILSRHSLYLKAAEKTRKYEFIKLLNDDLATKKLLAQTSSRFAEDCMLVTWDYNDPARPIVSDKYHSDINDAVLYAWRECRHYLAEPPKSKTPPRNSAAYMEMLEQKEMEDWERKQRGDDTNIDDADFLYSDDF